MPRPTVATVHLDALRRNYAVLADHCASSKLIPMLKADGYGHGASHVAAALDAGLAFAVATLEEAAALRGDGIEQPLLLLEGPFEPADLLWASEHNCWVMIHQQRQLEWLLAAKLPSALRVWLGIDSGMHRLGFAPADAAAAYRSLLGSTNVHSAIVLASHFHSAELGAAGRAAQIACFDAVASQLPAEQSLANSAAMIDSSDCQRDWCRPGIALYGAGHDQHCPTVAGTALQPAMSLRSEVIALRSVAAGETVGYGGRWRAERDSLLATVALGYADGYPRHAADGTPVLVAGQRARLAGRVSMDMITVDVSGLRGVALGSAVELWGQNLPVGEVALAADTISYQLLTGLSARVPRRYSR